LWLHNVLYVLYNIIVPSLAPQRWTTTTQLYQHNKIIFHGLSQIKILSARSESIQFLYVYNMYIYDTYTCAYRMYIRLIPSGSPRTAWQVYHGGYIIYHYTYIIRVRKSLPTRIIFEYKLLYMRGATGSC